MAITLEQLTSPLAILTTISRLKTPLSRFQQAYGMGVGGPNCEASDSKSIAIDIFDKVRSLASFSPPGKGPATRSPSPVGQFTGQTARVHTKTPLLMERIFNMRQIGGMQSELDRGGVQYITRQQKNMIQEFTNTREFMISRVLRGTGFSLIARGDHFIPAEAGVGTIAIDPQIPAGNKGNVGGIFSGNWQDSANAVPHDELLKLNDASEAASGYPIEHAWINGVTWSKLIKTLQVRQLAGDSTQPFAQYDRTDLTNAEGIGDTGFTARLRGIPWITWHVYGGQLLVNGTVTKQVPDNVAIFTPEPSSDWFRMVEAPEFVRYYQGDPGRVVTGFHSWVTEEIDPASLDLKAIDNCLPVVTVVNAIYSATVAA